jgi:hypothetical protein
MRAPCRRPAQIVYPEHMQSRSGGSGEGTGDDVGGERREEVSHACH